MIAFFVLGDGDHVFPVPQIGYIIPSLHDLNLKYEFQVYAVAVGLSNLVLISIEYLRVLTTFLLISSWNSFSHALNLASKCILVPNRDQAYHQALGGRVTRQLLGFRQPFETMVNIEGWPIGMLLSNKAIKGILLKK